MFHGLLDVTGVLDVWGARCHGCWMSLVFWMSGVLDVPGV